MLAEAIPISGLDRLVRREENIGLTRRPRMVMEEFPRQDWCAEEVDWEKMVLGVRTRCRDREGFTRWLKKWHLGFYAKQ